MSSRRFSPWLGAVLATLALACAAGPEGPTPYPQTESGWPGRGVVRHFGWMDENRKGFWLERERRQGAIVLAGDSLIGGWSTLEKDLPGLPVANRGIGSDVSRGLLFRFREDVLDLHPKAIVLLVGTNDLSALQDIRATRANLVAMLDMADRAMPGVPIVLCTLPPRNAPQAPVDPRQLAALNRSIAELARDRSNVSVLDLHALLVREDGAMQPAFFGPDGLHLSNAGYQRFREALLPLLKRLNVG